MENNDSLELLTPEQAGKILKLGRDKMLGLFNDGSIKTITISTAYDKAGNKREYRRTTRKWLEEWLEKEAQIRAEPLKISIINNKSINTKFPVGMKTTVFFKILKEEELKTKKEKQNG